MGLKSQNFQKLYRWHRWLGLILSVHILLLAITGVILVFREELGPAKNPSPPARGESVSLQSLVDKSLRQYPGDRVLALAVDDHDPNKISLRLGIDGSKKFRGARRLHYDRQSGEALVDAGKEGGFLHLVLELHRELFLGTWGKLYIGALGLVYAFILISGLLIYGPLMKRTPFSTLRTRMHPRQWWADVHKSFGALTFGWSLVIGLSGFLLGWGGPILKFYQASALKDLTREFPAAATQEPLAPLDLALQAAQNARPEGRFDFVAFPDTEFSTAHHYIFIMAGATPLTEKLSDLVVVDGYSGKLERVLVLPLYLKLLLLAEPLHFGDYGGLFMKILWVIFALGSMVLPLSGLRMFLQKYRKEQQERKAKAASRPVRSPGNRPYSLPLAWLLFSWAGISLALLVDGSQDLLANCLLAFSLVLPFWQLWRHRRAVSE